MVFLSKARSVLILRSLATYQISPSIIEQRNFGFWILRMRGLFGFPDSLAHQADFGLKSKFRIKMTML
jgi:hypothetical protein